MGDPWAGDAVEEAEGPSAGDALEEAEGPWAGDATLECPSSCDIAPDLHTT